MTLQVNAHDVDEPETPTALLPRPTYPIPSSPPPSFHSRASSRERQTAVAVDPDLADAFDDDSDDDADDRQRLVRANSTPSQQAQPATASTKSAAQLPQPPVHRPAPPVTPTTSRVYGSGIQADGVFSNLSAKPDRHGDEKDELPPVRPDSRPPTCLFSSLHHPY